MSDAPAGPPPASKKSWIESLIGFCLTRRVVVAIFVLLVIAGGLYVAPFDWDFGGLPRNPVAVDAIPDIGENQQIVFTEWPGRSPQDVEDQITYPLTTTLLGIPGVKTVRSYSMFGFSTIYCIFDESIDFYESRNRILAKLSALGQALPEEAHPALGPEATALGQVFWYTLEGRDPDGRPVGGWDVPELRSIQDWDVRLALQSAKGVAEVASVGGFVKEYQVDVDPDAMRINGVTLGDIVDAVRKSNVEVGARTMEINRVEYLVRGLGYVKDVGDLENVVVKVRDHVPVRLADVAHVILGGATRRGALDKEGADAVGGVVVVAFGYNPLAAIRNVKEKIKDDIAPGLPEKAVIDEDQIDRASVEAFAREHGFEAYEDGALNQKAWLSWLAPNRNKWPDWITTSKVTIVPFYDRTGLIYETLGTLSKALTEEILVTVIVVVVMVAHLASSLLISAMLPLAVLLCFVAMKVFGVDANVVALSGIAIAIGTIVDFGIILCENILRHLDKAPPEASRLDVVRRAAGEVGGSIVTAMATTVIGFLPVFFMTGAEGKLFKPLAFTKTFALAAALLVALVVLPTAAYVLFARKGTSAWRRRLVAAGLVVAGVVTGALLEVWVGVIVAAVGVYHLVVGLLPPRGRRVARLISNVAAVLVVGWVLSAHWMPLGPERGMIRNGLFVAGLIGGLLVLFHLFRLCYKPLLRWFLAAKPLFLAVPVALVVLGAFVWRGLGREFMPPLDEGSFLYMPTTMVHASIGEVLDVLRKQDQAIAAIPEVESVVGKLGRAETALDPAPVSMIETVINYKSEYVTDKDGHRMRFEYDPQTKAFVRDKEGNLIPDPRGRPYRQWRDEIKSDDDIWREITEAARIPGTTGAPKLQPIAARLVMLQSGMRAPMGVKVKGRRLEDIERAAIEIEQLLKEVPGVAANTVVAERVVGKPYIEIVIDDEAISRYGLQKQRVQEALEIAVGGKRVTTTVEGRERYPVRVRYLRELRDHLETIERILVAAPDGAQIPLAQLAKITHRRGPQTIKSEDAALIAYVTFDRNPQYAEGDVVEACKRYLEEKEESGGLALPPGTRYAFAGTYESQRRARKTLAVILPLTLVLIFLILYIQFNSVSTSLLVASSVLVAWAGGFLLIWLYGRPWFLDFSLFGVSLRELFQVHPIHLSVAIWVGFLALFGIASDDGVVMATYLDQTFATRRIRTKADVREATVEAAGRRIRPCLMTSATTILALIPVLTSTGRGSDVMVPMAIPVFGGMLVVLVSEFVVPVLYCAIKERRLSRHVTQTDERS